MTTLHGSTFDYLKPTEAQMSDMGAMREATRQYADAIDHLVPDGPDKTYILRALRTVAMWVNVSITRHPNGAPRLPRDSVTEYPADHPVKGDLGSVPL